MSKDYLIVFDGTYSYIRKANSYETGEYTEAEAHKALLKEFLNEREGHKQTVKRYSEEINSLKTKIKRKGF